MGRNETQEHMVDSSRTKSGTTSISLLSSIDVVFDDEALDRPEPRESNLPTVVASRSRRFVSNDTTADFLSVLSSEDILSARPNAGADPLIGRIIADRYRLLGVLGRGGMGSVYRVEHVRIGKLLAMKLLRGDLSQNPEAIQRFKREALTVSKLESPNTVQVFDFGVSDGLTYLVMELVGGDNLARVARAEGPMPFSRLGPLLVHVCNSLAEAHEKGIVHRDIKPENIMLVEGGVDVAPVAKVLDFGLAKLRESEGLAEVTHKGMILGTPSYMAPEQIRGETVDRRTDIYALGAMMYRLLTGEPPFSAATPLGILTKHLSEKPIAPIDRAPELGIPLGVSRLVMRAIRKDPNDRFQTIEELRARLLEELRAAGTESIDKLLDPKRLAPAKAKNATRDDVDAYERKLRRQRYQAIATVSAVGFGLAILTGTLAFRHTPGFDGAEHEPNNQTSEATALPFGEEIRAALGRRLDATHGDRDFFRVDVPESSRGLVGLHVTASASMPLCTLLYRQGLESPLGQYCVGRPGRDLLIPALQLEPGRYFLAVSEDLDTYGGAPTYVHESISDDYRVSLTAAAPAPDTEIEPNDEIATATQIGLGRRATGVLGWARDEDVFCVPQGLSAPIHWTVHAGFREHGVLEATPLLGRGPAIEERTPTRVHAEPTGHPSSSDVLSPWVSPPISGPTDRCLRVRLATDTWSADRAAPVPSGGQEPYWVEAEQAR
jgi:serine/threonine-protein kinase